MIINWRSIKEVGTPTDDKIGYLVSDGKNIEYSDLRKISDYYIWVGGSVYADYEEAPATSFDFSPTHWCSVSELNLPVED